MDVNQPDDMVSPEVVESNTGVRGEIRQLLSSRLLIFLLMFGVLGVLGIPLLWMSPVFSRGEKIVWSIVVTLYTLLLLTLAAGAIWLAYLALTPHGIPG